jgi:Ca2+/Na+ antiporter
VHLGLCLLDIYIYIYILYIFFIGKKNFIKKEPMCAQNMHTEANSYIIEEEAETEFKETIESATLLAFWIYFCTIMYFILIMAIIYHCCVHFIKHK